MQHPKQAAIVLNVGFLAWAGLVAVLMRNRSLALPLDVNRV
jgi:hypothetical protein